VQEHRSRLERVFDLFFRIRLPLHKRAGPTPILRQGVMARIADRRREVGIVIAPSDVLIFYPTAAVPTEQAAALFLTPSIAARGANWILVDDHDDCPGTA